MLHTSEGRRTARSSAAPSAVGAPARSNCR
jgi:hypothetical protein